MDKLNIHFPDNVGSLDFMFNSMFDEDVIIQKGTAWDPLTEEQFLLATYKTDNQNIVILGAVEFDVAAGLAAFLTRFQKSVLLDILKSKQFPEELMGNFYEIMNIASHIFNKEEYEHIAIHDLQLVKPSEINPSFTNVLKSPQMRLNASISISGGFGKGEMSYFMSNSPIVLQS